MKKIKKQAILLTLTLILILLACNAVSAADNSNNTVQSNNSSIQLYAANPTAATTNGASSKVVISGKVLKCSDGTPFSGVTVTASKGGTKLASTTTGSDGTYTLSFFRSDTVFNVTASYPGHISSSKNVTVASGADGNSQGVANFKLGLAYVYVSPSGKDSNTGADSSHPVQTIGKALSLVNNGGTIYLASGTYSKDKDIGLTIDRSVTIVGQGQINTIINAKRANQIFSINSGVTVTLEGLTLANGSAWDYGESTGYQGGAICNDGTLTLSGCTCTGNQAAEDGGAICNRGTIASLSGCTFTNNTANLGGAIKNSNIITSVSGCTFTNNTARTKWGGAIYNSAGTLTVTLSTFKNNSVNTAITEGDGAAIYNTGTLTATFSTFEDNTAESGAIWSKGTSTITGCAFTNNHATNIGGAIENYGTMTINLGTFTGNTANSAGAISNYGSLTISNSTFTGNTATKGGAISQRDDGSSGSNNALTITGSLFTGNTATTKGSAIYCGNNAGTCNIHFNSIYGNTGTNDIYSDSTINAINNWWGTNFSGTNPVNANRVNSNVDADPWIVLIITSSDNLVDLKGITAVIANLKYNSAGTDVSSLGTVPDADVVFAADSLGSISPARGTISKNLNAATTFTAGSTAGDSVVSAAVNGQTVTTTIKIRDLSNVYVNPNMGNDSTGDGSPTAPLQSLAKAISEVRAGGTVHVAKGTYSGANNRGISINKDVTIIGESQNNTIIDAQGQNTTFFVGYDFTVTIKNLTFSNGNATSSGNGGAIVSSGTLNLSNCTFINNTAEYYGGAICTNHPLNVDGCTFTNNTAKYGGAIGGTSYDPYTFTVHFSSFVNNTATTGNAIYCDNHGSTNAENNWWSSNNPAFSSLVYGTVDYSPWMVLNITSNTAAVKKGGSAAITVNMLYDSEGNYHDPALGHVPDGTAVSFTGTRGSLNPTGSTLIGGQTTSVFTANAAGAAAVFAAVDDGIVQTSITVDKSNTGLVVGNVTGVNGKSVNLTATLTDDDGPVSSEIVTFKVNGVTVGTATTNDEGLATLNYIIAQDAGFYTIDADFAGDDNYILSSGTGNLIVNTINTILTVNNATGYNGKSVNLIATLKDADGNPLSGKTVTFNINGTNYDRTIDSSGVATLSYTISETAGVYTVTADFAGDDNYILSSGTGNLTVNTKDTALIVGNAAGVNGKTVNLTATLKDADGNPLSGKTVTFNVNGTDYTTITDASGLATLSYKLTKAGVYTVSASFIDGLIYANGSGSGNLTVSPAANLYIKITVSNNNPKVGEKFLLTYKLGNYGPDAAENVTITFKLPEGLDFVKVTADTGNCTYDPATRTMTWTLDYVPVGDPYLYFTVKAADDGIYKITSSTTSTTYCSNSADSGSITINVKLNNNNSNNESTVNAASKTTKTMGLQETGLPLNYLILAIFMILSGLVVPKRK